MKKSVHNFLEAKALIKEAIENGTIFDLEGCSFVSHSGKWIADVQINQSGRVDLRIKGDWIDMGLAMGGK